MDRARASRPLAAWSAVLVLLVSTGCETEFEREYDEAESLRRLAAEQGFEWIGTADLLAEAQAREAVGETAEALQLVAKARMQADAALQQAEREADAWQRRVLR